MKVLNSIFSLLFFLTVINGLKPNIVLFITDDQDILMNGMGPMIKTKKLLKEFGTTFNNAYATSPICCPSRASILTGLYQHNHGVFNNSLSGGCSNKNWQTTHETHTFAVELQKLGYSTFYAGKYLNQYGSKGAGGPNHIPPGWEQWVGLIGNSKYYNYTLSIDGKRKYFTNHYLTKVLSSYSLKFIEKQDKTKPFLMVIAPPAPHHPFIPEPKYRGYFEGKQVPRTIQFNYSNNTRKHWLVRMKPSPLPEKLVTLLDDIYARRWETLLSVDDLIESVVKSLEYKNLLQDTYIIFSSDNGFHLGQLSFTWDKRQMYEFDIKVPLIIRGPDIPKNISVNNPTILPDIAPTISYIAGLKNFTSDGTSFLPIRSTPRRTFLIEYHGEGGSEGNDPYCWSSDSGTSHCSLEASCKCQDSTNNTYMCIRGMDNLNNFVYCQFDDDEAYKEAYDLRKDPFQLNNCIDNLRPTCKYKLKYGLRELMLCKSFNCRHNVYLKHLKFHKCL